MKKDEFAFIKSKLSKAKLGNYKSVKTDLEVMGIDAIDRDLHRIKLLLLEGKNDDEIMESYSSLSSEAVLELEKKHSSVTKKPKKPASARQPKLSGTKTTEKNAIMNHKVVDYKILSDKHYSSLQRQVENAIKKGWQPLGGMAVYNPGANIGSVPDHFFQTIVMYK